MDGGKEFGPFSEIELRQRLGDAPKQSLASLRVRQGSSPWYDGRHVLERFRQLTENGVYLARNSTIEGPFTAQRAVEILASSGTDGTRVKVGRNDNWQPAEAFLTRMRSPTGAAGTGAAGTGDAEEDAPLAPATLISDDEDDPSASDDLVPAVLVAEPVRPPSASAHNLPHPVAMPPKPIAIAPIRTPALPARHGNPSGLVICAAVAGVLLVLMVPVAIYFLIPWSEGSSAAGGAEDAVNGAVSLDDGSRGPGASASAPIVAPGTLFRPLFHTHAGEVDAGTAFAARLPGSNRPILLSALHLLGPAGGLETDMPAPRVPAMLYSMSLTDCISGEQRSDISGRPLLIPLARPIPESSPMGDVVAYLPDRIDGFQPLPLSPAPPRRGETVWLVSEVIGSTAVTHRARVQGVEDGWLMYQFDSREIELRATSGAPVVNASHEVVAIHAGGGSQGGTIVGAGTPTTKFIGPLTAATFSGG